MRSPLLSLGTALVCSLALSAQTPEAAGGDKKPEPPKEKPFAELIKDAQAIPGLFPLYQTEEKVYMELAPAQLDKMYLLSLTCESGLGERGFYASQMCGEMPFLFRKSGKNIQWVLKNTGFTAREGTPIRRAVDHSFSDSMLGLAKIESFPHPDRKSVLIDLGALLLTDAPLLSYALEEEFRIPYRFDAKNSTFGKLKGFERNTEIETIAHYAAERPPLPPLLPPGAPAPPMPPPPRNLPDIRSMILHLRYSLFELPPDGYRPRLADDRVGHFLEQAEDFTTDITHRPTRRYITRWRLEKLDPRAALSPPKQPIVYWLENTIPLQYRDAIRDGILLWNKAFERIGYKDAVVVKQQPDDADWDPADVRYSTVRWFTCTDCSFAVGPSITNPLTGEILDADIGFSEALTRFFRRELVEQIGPVSWSWDSEAPRPFLAPWSRRKAQYFCDLAEGATRDAQFAFDVLLARGLDPEGPEADKFVRDFLKEIAAHEVGHTLGLRHNFRASTIHTLEQAQNPELTAREGLTGSVMDYIPSNIARRGAKQGEYHQSTLGPYDYWAIEYAYKPIDAPTPEAELPELRKIAARSAEPLLAYATDEDAGINRVPLDMDPTVNRFDLGSDPLAYYAHRVKLAQEVWDRMEEKLERPGEGYQVLRRSFASALSQAGRSLYLASKYIGGVAQYRDHVGDPGGRIPLQPAPTAKQKEALQLLRSDLFDPQAFSFSPRLLNKLNTERFSDFTDPAAGLRRNDVPIHAMVLGLQKSVLDRLYHPVVMARVLDSEVKAASPADLFHLSDLFQGLQDSIWAETASPNAPLAINSYRRSLQREHLRKLIGLVLREAAVPEDSRTLARQGLTALRAQLQTALAKGDKKMPGDTRAHVAESIARIDETLKANMQRMAF
ncbi:MAG: zinc-dependent metalloprotease [Acidobacteria bacterium]|nr:zinc-dependent metalloprotease [Acidobacteriota bacterium]